VNLSFGEDAPTVKISSNTIMVANVRFCLIGRIEISVTLLKRKNRQKKQHEDELHREKTRDDHHDYSGTAVGIPL